MLVVLCEMFWGTIKMPDKILMKDIDKNSTDYYLCLDHLVDEDTISAFLLYVYPKRKYYDKTLF